MRNVVDTNNVDSIKEDQTISNSDRPNYVQIVDRPRPNPKVRIDHFAFYLINIQGLTSSKLVEIEDLVVKEPLSLFFLTETQLKVDKFRLREGLFSINNMRAPEDTKGGGLMVIYNSKIKLKITKTETACKDILESTITYGNVTVKVILIYMSVNNKNKNIRIVQEVNKIVGESDNPVFVIGDFNSHIGFLGEQPLNENGKLVLELMEGNDLTMVNDTPLCQSTYTWTRGVQRSVIDFVLVNNLGYKMIYDMYIDEDQEIMDLSDHNLIKIRLNINTNKPIFNKDKWTETEFYKTDAESLQKYTSKLQEKLQNVRVKDMNHFNQIVKQSADETIRKVYRRKVDPQAQEIQEQPWMTTEIRTEIKLRKEINRKKRKADTVEDMIRLKQEFQDQKKKGQLLIKKEITLYEKKETQRIKTSKNKSKDMWEHIRKLSKNEITKTNQSCIYSTEGGKLQQEEAMQKMEEFWTQIYQKHENQIDEAWNEEVRQRYAEDISQMTNNILIDDMTFSEVLREHMDMAMTLDVSREMQPMEFPIITEQEVKSTLRSIKNNKAAGNDNLKPELYKCLVNNDYCIKELTRCFNIMMNDKLLPEEWKSSITKMIPKTARPTVKDFRPIALLNCSYKIFMSIMKEKIEKQLLDNEAMKETQSGFTKGGRTEDNVLILQYCIEESFKNKKPLIITAIDFKKAYDSIKRDSLVKALLKYKVHPLMIDIITEIYKDDKTTLTLSNNIKLDINITSGIRQGCTGSTTLFKLITYVIIQKLEQRRNGFSNDKINLNTLFFADDGLQLSQSLEQAAENLRFLTQISRECGLELNKDKSSVIIFNMYEQPEQVEGIEVVSSIKYLGFTINNTRNIFTLHKQNMFKKAEKLANLTYPVIAKSCNKLMIGKTYWKSLALPSILYGTNVLSLNKKDITKLQRIEYKVYRQMLGAAKYTPVTTLRGEIGASSMKSRLIEGKLQYLRSIIEHTDNTDCRNKLLKEIVSDMKDKGHKWHRDLNDMLTTVSLRYGQVGILKKEEIKSKIREWDNKKWQEEMHNKTSLRIYRQQKPEIRSQEDVYDNTAASILLFKCRSNTLPLNDRKRFVQGDTSCQLCGAEIEDLAHLLLKCPEYDDLRPEELKDNQTQDELILGNFLFNVNHEFVKENINKIWKKRKKRLEEIQPN